MSYIFPSTEMESCLVADGVSLGLGEGAREEGAEPEREPGREPKICLVFKDCGMRRGKGGGDQIMQLTSPYFGLMARLGEGSERLESRLQRTLLRTLPSVKSQPRRNFSTE